MEKTKEKELALQLRKEGLSYNEILKQINVAKSTLSLWLRSVGLSKTQKQRLSEKKLISIQRGWKKWHEQRVNLVNQIKSSAQAEIDNLSGRELWLIGTALYWAEGSKERETSIGNGLRFCNSDPAMIKFYVRWLTEVLRVKTDEIKYELYIHETRDYKKAVKFWSQVVGCDLVNFKYIYFKKNKINTRRRNIGENYNGLLRISVRQSSRLHRKVSGWIEGIARFAV